MKPNTDAKEYTRDRMQQAKRYRDLLAALRSLDKQIDVLMTWVRDDMPPLTAVCARDTQFAARALIAKTTGERLLLAAIEKANIREQA